MKKILSRFFKTSNNKRRLYLRNRMHNILLRDRDIDGTWPILGYYVKYGGFGYNCFRSEKPLWWVTKD